MHKDNIQKLETCKNQRKALLEECQKECQNISKRMYLRCVLRKASAYRSCPTKAKLMLYHLIYARILCFYLACIVATLIQNLMHREFLVSADRRATVLTTTSLSHAAIREKKLHHLI